jgi:hypothetical protein
MEQVIEFLPFEYSLYYLLRGDLISIQQSYLIHVYITI